MVVVPRLKISTSTQAPLGLSLSLFLSLSAMIPTVAMLETEVLASRVVHYTVLQQFAV